MRNWESELKFADNPPRRREIERVLRALGWRPTTTEQRAHVVWVSPDGKRTTCVAGHKGKDVSYGTFRAILRQVGISEQDFYKLK